METKERVKCCGYEYYGKRRRKCWHWGSVEVDGYLYCGWHALERKETDKLALRALQREQEEGTWKSE